MNISLAELLSGTGNGVGLSYQLALETAPLPKPLALFATACCSQPACAGVNRLKAGFRYLFSGI